MIARTGTMPRPCAVPRLDAWPGTGARRPAAPSMFLRHFLRTLAAVVAVSIASVAQAQPWPAKPIRFLVAAPAGSSLDTLARVIGERLKDRLGQPILKLPEVAGKMHASGFDLIGGTPEDFGDLIRRETDRWAPVIRKLGLKID